MNELTPKRAPLGFRAVIFDMDGLMFDTERLARIAWNRAAADWGYEAIPDDVYLRLIGRTAPAVKQIVQHSLGHDVPIDEMAQRAQHYLDEAIRHQGLPLKPGLLNLLDWLDRVAISKGVASSTSRERVLQKLAMAGLTHRFGAVVGGDEIRNGKPAPDIFCAAAERLDVSAGRCVVLEDSEAGVRAAYAAGMVPVMVPDLKPPSDEIIALAYRVFPSLYDVKAFLEDHYEL